MPRSVAWGYDSFVESGADERSGSMSRRWMVVLAGLALVAVACKTPADGGTGSGQPTPTPVKGYPSSMVALGDSITAGYGSCLAPTACLRNSWATGDGTQVKSHYRRIVA